MPPMLEVKFFGGPIDKIRIPAVESLDEFTPKIREFHELLAAWYRRNGKERHRKLRAEDLIGQHSTFIIRAEKFAILFEGGGDALPDCCSLCIFNPEDVIVGEYNVMHPKPVDQLPERWPHGALVIDGSKPLDLEPQVIRPHLWFSQGLFRVIVYDLLSERVRGAEDLFGFSLLVFNERGEPVFTRRYIWSGFERDEWPPELEYGTPIVNARKQFEYVPADPAHSRFDPS